MVLPLVDLRDACCHRHIWCQQCLCSNLPVCANIKFLGPEHYWPLYQHTRFLLCKCRHNDWDGCHSLHHANSVYVEHPAPACSEIWTSVLVRPWFPVSGRDLCGWRDVLRLTLRSVVVTSCIRLYIVNDVLRHGDLSCMWLQFCDQNLN
jgi:hypothetical protein